MNLDLCITLRCNQNCLNCYRFCNKKEITGLDYSDLDMTLGQVDNFVHQVREHKMGLLDTVSITGGEPLIHPKKKEILRKVIKLKEDGYVSKVIVNSNRTVKIPRSMIEYIVTYSRPRDNYQKHNVVLLHPSDFSDRKHTYNSCTHYRKHTIVLNYHGYSLCCGADGYIRLFAMDDLIVDYLPESSDGFPLMDKICEHCAFGSDDILPFERELGCPVSIRYLKEAENNRAGRKITKRFPEWSEA